MKLPIRPKKFLLLSAFLAIILLPKHLLAQTDACGSAPAITSSVSPGTCTAGTLAAGSTYTAIAGLPVGCNLTNNDVWFKFVAQTTNPNVKYTAGTLVNGQIQLFSGACGAQVSISCGTNLSPIGLTIGNTYLVRIYSTTNATGTFNICLTDPAPANDNCAGAIALNSASTCVNTQGNMVGATLTAGVPATACGVPTYDVWYSFTAQTPNPTITVSGNTNFTSPHIQILSGTCATLANVSCSNTGTITAAGLAVGTSYFVRVYSTTAVPSTAGTFNICITDPAPANDNCAGAVSLTSGTSCVNTAGTVIGSTLTAGVPVTACGTPIYDVWYSFTAQSTNPTITISGATNFSSPHIQLLSGTCGTLANVTCSNTASLTASGLTIGSTYFIRAFSTTALPTTNGTFNICVTDPAPANDLCAGAIALTSAASCVNTSGNMVGATLTAGVPAPACGAPTYDVWYSFTAQTPNPTITISSNTNFTSPHIQILSGTCGTLADVGCSATGTMTASGLTVGTAYFVRVYSTAAVPTTAGTFNICITDPAPANDNCAGAVSLTSGTSCVNTAGTVIGSTLTAGVPVTACGTPIYDVWYSFTAQSTNPTITISGATNFSSPHIQLLSGTCGTLANVTCSNTASLTASGLTIGSTYFIRAFSTTALPTTNGTFNICVTDPAPANDLCASAIALTSAASCVNTSGNMVGATLTAGVPAPACGVPTYDVWYSFTAQTPNPTITISGNTNFANPHIQILSGTCGTLANVSCSNTGAITASGLTVGTSYFVRVYSTSAVPTTAGSFNICITDPAPANDDCAGAVSLTSGTSCVNTGGTVIGATLTAGIPAPACGSPVYDVWYSFTAQSTNPTITISGATNFASPHIQLLSGSCGSLVNVTCSATATLTASGLTIGNTYFIRAYSTAALPTSNGTFNICVTDPAPANDNCAGAVSLTSGTSCVNTQGNMVGATLTAGVPATACGVPTYDVWYSFTAQTTNPTITISGNTNFTSPHLQILSGTCGTLANLACSNTGTLTASGLTIGTSYFVRVYSTAAVPTTAGTFNICITDPAPANDDCAGAISLTPGSTCVTTTGNVVGATLSAGIPLPVCGTPTYDIWYSFTAASTLQTIAISGNTNFANPGIQVLSGACGSLTTVACSATASLTVSGLTIGTSYFVRVYSTSAVPTTAGTFGICITNLPVNDDCTGAITLTSSSTCSNTAGTLVNATNVVLPSTCAALTGTRKDVWYSFVAQSVNPTITISSAPANPRFQVYSGICGSLTSVFCSTSGSQAATGLTIGTTYLVRVYSNTDASGTFNICIVDPAPANDLCANAVVLTSATTCATVTGNMYGGTVSATTINSPDCAGSVVYDVWYKFVAQTTNPTITLSNIGSNFTNPAMELLSNNCGGTFTAYFCGTTSIAANYLTPGTTYFIRVYSSSGTAPTTLANSNFDICVVDPVANPPFNDDCANAINVPIWNTCNNVTGTVAGATASPIALGGSCTGPLAYDVWYKFTAVNATASIALSSIGANFLNPKIEVLSGSCGSFTSIACGTSPVSAAGLTAGNTYYVRVYSNTAPAPNGNAGFSICATTTNAPVRFGNSYVNLSKRSTGGVVQPGDTLEIRMTVNHTSGTMFHMRYLDNVPTKTNMLTGTADSIRIITNEGLTYKKYTLASGDDAATYTASPAAGEYNIRLNLGFGGSSPGIPVNNSSSESVSATGQMSNTDKPKGGGGLLFATSYRVVVTGAVGDTITLNPGQFIYQTASSGQPDVTLTASPFQILISNPLNLCTNSIGLNNAVENGGTFGAGASLNRSTDLTTPIAGYTFVPDVSSYTVVGDGRYAIIKNNSPRSSPVPGARRQPNCNVAPTLSPNDPLSCNNRMFGGFWFIAGDHSGTATAAGNAPPDATTTSGYMLEVNADYVASEVYRQTLTNLCPNTYYEFSAWIKNICPTCGIDSSGSQFTGTATAPANGYPGVLPNLTFALDNLDYYNTGELDTLGWLKKGFVFKTAPGQTTATFSIRNNAQGGGGNDWALDDIAIATCLPTMQYSPSINPMVCQANSLAIFDTVSSYFNNYTSFKWERSTDLGNNWTDITVPVDTTVTLVGSTYRFISKYTIPATQTTLANSNDLYRVVVATSSSNLLNTSCLYTDASTIITLNVLDCGPILKINLLSFNGKNNNGYANLQWVTTKEDEPINFDVEKSYDGSSFRRIGTVKGHGGSTETNYYEFDDPSALSGKTWYRLALVNKDGKKIYSRVITLSDKNIEFGFANVVNPFNQEVDFEISAPANSRIQTVLINLSGKAVRREDFSVYQGMNSLAIPGTDNLPPGMYVLQVKLDGQLISKKLMKK